jgi:hypothetical protein
VSDASVIPVVQEAIIGKSQSETARRKNVGLYLEK